MDLYTLLAYLVRLMMSPSQMLFSLRLRSASLHPLLQNITRHLALEPLALNRSQFRLMHPSTHIHRPSPRIRPMQKHLYTTHPDPLTPMIQKKKKKKKNKFTTTHPHPQTPPPTSPNPPQPSPPPQLPPASAPPQSRRQRRPDR